MRLSLDKLREDFGNGTEEEITKACFIVDARINSYDRAVQWISMLVARLLAANRYVAAASILWGRDLFDPRPQSVRRMLSAIDKSSKLIVLGAGSMGKSYTLIAWIILDWLRDPQWTGARIISTTSGHAEANTFSHLQRFYSGAIIPLPGTSQHGFIGLDTKDRHSAISLLAIKEGDTGRNTLQGFHPSRRSVAHPIFGLLSRVRIFLDEAEQIPPGVWKGVLNILGSRTDTDTVKAICASNPIDPTSTLAGNAEPPWGWNRTDADVHKEWQSKLGWSVLRLDGADCENVKDRKLVYPGLMTWQGYEDYRSPGNGASADYWTYARGMYPMQGTVDCLIPISYMDDFFGELVFEPGTAIACAGLDLAFDGDDDVVLFVGRYGRAHLFRPAQGKPIEFSEPRYCLQLDNFYELPKVKTHAQYRQVKAICDQLGINFDWLTIDRTGVGAGVSDLFHEFGFTGSRGVHWGSGATDVKILDEDRDLPSEVCADIGYEMYFALRKWLEFGFIKANPVIDMSKLQKEITGRRKKTVAKGPSNKARFKLESKPEFRRRYPHSPDRADALVMMLHGCRLNGPEKAQMARQKRKIAMGENIGIMEKLHFVDFSRSEDE
jgi:hypothetical protein